MDGREKERERGNGYATDDIVHGRRGPCLYEAGTYVFKYLEEVNKTRGTRHSFGLQSIMIKNLPTHLISIDRYIRFLLKEKKKEENPKLI